jgi:hypothetical protein
VKFELYRNFCYYGVPHCLLRSYTQFFFQVSDDTITEFMEKVVKMIDDGKFSSDASLSRYPLYGAEVRSSG